MAGAVGPPLATGLSVVEDLFPGVKELIGDTGNGLLSIDTHTRARARAPTTLTDNSFTVDALGSVHDQGNNHGYTVKLILLSPGHAHNETDGFNSPTASQNIGCSFFQGATSSSTQQRSPRAWWAHVPTPIACIVVGGTHTRASTPHTHTHHTHTRTHTST